MSFEWKRAGKSFACTQGDMARICLALDEMDVLDGPPSRLETLPWLRARGGCLPDARDRVRVMALRMNGYRLSTSECVLVAASLRALIRDERWSPYARRVRAGSEERRFLEEFADFCAACSDGCADGDGDAAPPYTEVHGKGGPRLVRDESLLERVTGACSAAQELARARFGEELSFTLDGLAALDRIAVASAGRTEGNDDATLAAARHFAIHAGECMRRLHGGFWGRVDDPRLLIDKKVAVRLDTGAVLLLLDLGGFFYKEESWATPIFTLEERGRAPYPIP